MTLALMLTASILQPVVGPIIDRRPAPLALVAGMTFTLIGLLLLSTAWTFPLLLLAAALVGVGSSVFHPESSRVARMASGGQHGLLVIAATSDLFWTGALAVIIGLILSSAFSAIVVYVQELVPGRVGLISGVFFGFAFGRGGIGAAVLGQLADRIGIERVYGLCLPAADRPAGRVPAERRAWPVGILKRSPVLSGAHRRRPASAPPANIDAR